MLESKVLLIEDDPAIVENLSAYLKEERFEVTAVDGQSKALAQIEAGPYPAGCNPCAGKRI